MSLWGFRDYIGVEKQNCRVSAELGNDVETVRERVLERKLTAALKQGQKLTEKQLGTEQLDASRHDKGSDADFMKRVTAKKTIESYYAPKNEKPADLSPKLSRWKRAENFYRIFERKSMKAGVLLLWLKLDLWLKFWLRERAKSVVNTF